MLSDDYLTIGLNALARAHAMDYFADGHRGAAIIAAQYLCHENGVSDETQGAIEQAIDAQWGSTPLCAAFGDEPADPALLDDIARTLEGNIARLRQVGHNVIFAMLALKAFKRVPAAITPSRVDGVCKLIESFDRPEEVTLAQEDEYPSLEDADTFAAFILEEALAATDRFSGYGNGYSGHLLTYGQALLELSSLGYPRLTQDGIHAYKLFVKVARRGPGENARSIPDHEDRGQDPLTREYWERKGGTDFRLGHCFKYPYSYYNLLNRSDGSELKQRWQAKSYTLF